MYFHTVSWQIGAELVRSMEYETDNGTGFITARKPLIEKDFLMMKPEKCFYNVDTGCVELHITNGAVISINCTQLENEITNNMYERSELDWLIHNEPLTYADLVLHGGIEEYIKGSKEHKLNE